MKFCSQNQVPELLKCISKDIRNTMLSLLYDESGDIDYTELTLSYMSFFSLEKFHNLLNTTQNGAAHSSSGIELSVLVKNVITSLCFCIIQLTFFCFFRTIFKFLYQPRCCCVPISQRMEPLPKGLLSWILPTLKNETHFYLAMGLDAYFFVRFISILLLFFLSVGFLNMFVLIPLNLTGRDSQHSATGLDRLSLSNISVSKVGRLNGHFVMSLLTIVCFHWVLIYELQSFVRIRQAYLQSKKHKSHLIHKTLLISNLPYYGKDGTLLKTILLVIPGGVQRIWYVNDFQGICTATKKAKEALQYLEQAEMKYLCAYMKKYTVKNNDRRSIDYNESRKTLIHNPTLADESLYPLFYPPIYLPTFKLPYSNTLLDLRLPSFLRLFLFQKRVHMIDWSLQQLEECQKTIDHFKILQAEDKLPKLDKVFVQFESQTSAYIAHQCLLSQIQGNLDITLIEVHPHDILWNNLLHENSTVSIFEKYLVVILSTLIIILYVVPVSFIGLISQLPLLTQLIPSMRWIYRLPEEIRDSISSFLPAVLLSILTDILLITFRCLTYYKRKLTGAQLEIDLQKWYFSFLFVQQFLVVTILTSIIVVFKQIVEQPTSIPILLAANLPKAATFFFQYISLKAFAFCGNKFLRLDELFLHFTWYKIKDITPRQRFYRLITLPRVNWGSVYPVFSVYGSIGLAYCLISPLISVFITFILSLALLYYKYSLKYIYNHINISETYGRLYPIALFNLYTGIYCLEFCLIGIFFSLKNNQGICPMKIQGTIMLIVLLLTIFGNISIYQRYVNHFSYLPILSDKDPSELDPGSRFRSPKENADELSLNSNSFYLNQAMFYSHPSFKYEKPKIWLPKDHLSESDREIKRLIEKSSVLQGGSTKGAKIEVLEKFKKIRLTVTEAAPDYK